MKTTKRWSALFTGALAAALVALTAIPGASPGGGGDQAIVKNFAQNTPPLEMASIQIGHEFAANLVKSTATALQDQTALATPERMTTSTAYTDVAISSTVTADTSPAITAAYTSIVQKIDASPHVIVATVVGCNFNKGAQCRALAQLTGGDATAIGSVLVT